ncbi:DUF4350 domain-containing protein [Gordonia crocea]|uniref:Putative membrane protein n=1 Tax=Gordonia crocea TaxID=589162 RepID=A0A7M3SU05_9ACTN|nr:DUF4350 domain-containing protein [Gordonia crocea]GED96129.1 putative membrane protein [Gordonia crocea]
MSAPAVVPPPAPAAGDGAPEKKRHTGTWVAVLGVVAVGLIAALVLGVLIVAGTSDKKPAENEVPGDPGNSRSDGTAALVETLKSHGVPVRVARAQSEVQGWRDASSSTVVVISRATGASVSSSRVVASKARNARRIVLLDPRPEVLSAWGISIDRTELYGDAVNPVADCSAAGIAPTDTAAVPSTAFTASSYDRATVCFRTAKNSAFGATLVFPASYNRPEIVVTQQDWFTNGSILNRDQAGIGVRMIGTGTEVAWFAPDYSDLQHDNPAAPPSQKKAGPDVPRWVWPMIGLGFFVLIAMMLWRGRRFGALVAEPLPAVVKATETTEARGRLYHSAADAQRAAQQLREYALRTMPRRLGVSRHAPVDDVIAAVCRATGRDHAAVTALLAGPLPVDTDDLVRFATDLSTLEEEVRPVL